MIYVIGEGDYGIRETVKKMGCLFVLVAVQCIGAYTVFITPYIRIFRFCKP